MTEPTLMPHARRYVDERRKRGEYTVGTARNASWALRAFSESFGNRPLDQLGPRAVERWQEGFGHLSPATRRQRLSYVRGFAAWMVKRALVKSDFTADIPPIRQPRAVPRALPAEKVARLLAACPDARARAMVWLMVGCGLRCVEVARLEYADYDERTRTLRVVGKAGNQRDVPVPVEVAAALAVYRDELPFRYGPLIRSHLHPSRGISADTVSGLVGRWCDLAGIKARRRDGISAHALRHTAASDVLEACNDLRVVQALLGHQHLSTTSIYLRHVDLATMRKAMAGRDYRLPSTVGIGSR